MPWDYGMDNDKSRWESVSKNLKREGYTILGNDEEYLYWAKWKKSRWYTVFEQKDPMKSMAEIRKMLVDDYNAGKHK